MNARPFSHEEGRVFIGINILAIIKKAKKQENKKVTMVYSLLLCFLVFLIRCSAIKNYLQKNNALPFERQGDLGSVNEGHDGTERVRQ